MRNGAVVAVVIPALNEEQSIAKVVSAIPGWVDDIVVVDNGSWDSTPEIAARYGARVLSEPRRGYGAACLQGISQLHDPDVVLFMDGDFSDRPEEAPALVDPIISGAADLVVGSRVLGQRESGALSPQARFGNWLACWLMRFLWNARYTDLGPFRAISFTALQRLHMADPDYGWTVEMQIKAARDRLKVLEVPVSYRRRIGKSKVSGTLRGVVGAGTKILWTIFKAAIGALPSGPCGGERIILFTRYPVEGKAKTRLIPVLGPQGAADLQRKMTEHGVASARSVSRLRSASLEIRYDGGSEPEMARWLGDDIAFAEQGLGDLGTRMHAALKSAFQEGIERVVLIGSDLPGMTATLLQNALDALSHCDVVLGPAADGGYYLIGMKRPCLSLFKGIPWGTSAVLEQTLSVARNLGFTVKLTDRLVDVDRPEDLEHFGVHQPDSLIRCSKEATHRSACPRISVIMPTLNEEDTILGSLERVLEAEDVEAIVVDGGSADRTVQRARSLGITVLQAPRGRASQMNSGARVASGEILLFLHADTLLPQGWKDLILNELRKPGTAAATFRLRLSPRTGSLRAVELLANFRSRLFRMPYGDQTISVKADLFHGLGGYCDMPIMEDWDLVRRLRRHGLIRIAAASVATSSRRWNTYGAFRTTALNQIIILGYLLGISPARLAKLYRDDDS